jgi:hypothetical protein
MERDQKGAELIELGTASGSTLGHGTIPFEPIGLMLYAGISDD